MRVFGLMGFQAASLLPAIKGSLKPSPRHSAMNILNLAARPITLTDADTSRPIALTLDQIRQQLAHYPPSEYAWETAIQTVEDALYPLRDLRQNTQPLAVQGAAACPATPSPSARRNHHARHAGTRLCRCRRLPPAKQPAAAAANHRLLRRIAAVARMGAPLG